MTTPLRLRIKLAEIKERKKINKARKKFSKIEINLLTKVKPIKVKSILVKMKGGKL